MFAASAFSALPLATVDGTIYGTAVVDTASAAEDKVATYFAFGGNISDGVSATEQAFTGVIKGASIGEGAVALSQNTALAVFASTISESARTVTVRQVGGGYSAGAMSSGPFSALGDSTTVFPGEAIFASINVQSAVADTVIAQDIVPSNIFFGVAVAAGAQINEFVLATPEYPREVAESSEAQDTISAIPEYNQRIEEDATGSETVSSLGVFGSFVNEISTASEFSTNLGIFKAAVTELARGSELMFAQTTVNARTIETVHAIDEKFAKLQWESINTSGIVDWVLVQTSGSTT